MNDQNAALSLAQLQHPDVLANPYPFYHQLRSEDPVHWDEMSGSWVVTRHADVMDGLRDNRFSAVRLGNMEDWLPPDLHETLAPVMRAMSRQILFLDPPDHTRLRRLAHKAFTPRVVEGMRQDIQGIVDRLLGEVEGTGHMELIRDFAHPLPVIVIAQMLGVPADDRDQFTRWTEDYGSLLDGAGLSPEGLVRCMIGVAQLIEYLKGVAADHQANPRDDLMQGLLNAREAGDALDEDELIGNCILLLAAGHGTTTHLIGNGLVALLRHPDELRRLQQDPSLWPSAVLELLRYESPVQATARVARETLALSGRTIEAGQGAVFVLGAANRDPDQFPDPDRLDVGRADNHHVAFGQGIHFCLGAPLARLEGQIALRTLLERLPHLGLETDALVWEPSITFRALREVPLVFG